MRLWTGCLLLFISVLLCNCDGEAEKPYLEIVAESENPARGTPFTVRQIVRPELIQYTFRTSAVTGVVKNQPYQVKVKLLEKSTGQRLAEITRTFRSNINQSDLPEKALTIGPGYHPNPALKLSSTSN